MSGYILKQTYQVISLKKHVRLYLLNYKIFLDSFLDKLE